MCFRPIVSYFVFAIQRTAESKVFASLDDAPDCDLAKLVSDVTAAEELVFVVDVSHVAVVFTEDVSSAGHFLVDQDRGLLHDQRTSTLEQEVQT